jgi:hypothetical protein
MSRVELCGWHVAGIPDLRKSGHLRCDLDQLSRAPAVAFPNALLSSAYDPTAQPGAPPVADMTRSIAVILRFRVSLCPLPITYAPLGYLGPIPARGRRLNHARSSRPPGSRLFKIHVASDNALLSLGFPSSPTP